jgi:hypothetical protein
LTGIVALCYDAHRYVRGTHSQWASLDLPDASSQLSYQEAALDVLAILRVLQLTFGKSTAALNFLP